MEEVYYNKLIALMKSTTKYADTYRIDDTFIEREKELLSSLKKKISNTIKSGKEYLLTDCFLYFVAYTSTFYAGSKLGYMNNVYKHFDTLINENDYVSIKEVINYCDFVYSTITLELRERVIKKVNGLLSIDGHNDINYIENTLKNMFQYGRPPQRLCNTQDAYELMKRILILILSYSIYTKTKMTDYEDFIKNMLVDLDLFFEKMEMNDICKRELLSKRLDYLCDDRFLLYLSTQVKEDKNDNIK